MANKGKYVIQLSSASMCPDCRRTVDLLCPKFPNTVSLIMFYICWECKKVFQIGVGEVERDDEKD